MFGWRRTRNQLGAQQLLESSQRLSQLGRLDHHVISHALVAPS